jgi:D-sedoheptulose 7-phosphate isomerase
LKEEIKHIIASSIKLKTEVLHDELILNSCQLMVEEIVETLKNKQRLFFCGNGGSAADALHLAAEFSGRFYLNRTALPVEALNVNMAAITAISNDFGFDHVYARMLESKATKGDILCVLSTSGQSLNIINAVKKAREMGVKSYALTGSTSSPLDDLADEIIKIPSVDTPRIQECHLMIGHIICELVEKKLFNE